MPYEPWLNSSVTMTGSSRSNSSTERVVVGRVGRPHGLDGALYVWPDTDDPRRFASGAKFMVAGRGALEVQRTRIHLERLLVKFVEVSDRASAEQLRGAELYIEERQRRRLGSEEFWPDELEGLEVRTAKGTIVGRVKGVEWSDAQSRLVVETEHGLREVPFVDELVPSVNLGDGYLTLVDLPGLL
ncbi:MAG: 16S rRNA processing protein RimM [Acidimicrobiia bacterium]|nr:16S rRNA processing protein RimM [Acidimicrobiia bacterium]MYD41586.1 16S rRNA processing protein RimM [Acidimicrobiia bacterium]